MNNDHKFGVDTALDSQAFAMLLFSLLTSPGISDETIAYATAIFDQSVQEFGKSNPDIETDQVGELHNAGMSILSRVWQAREIIKKSSRS